MKGTCFSINLLGSVLGITLCLSLQSHTAVQAARAQSQQCLSAALRGLPAIRVLHGPIPLGSISHPSSVSPLPGLWGCPAPRAVPCRAQWQPPLRPSLALCPPQSPGLLTGAGGASPECVSGKGRQLIQSQCSRPKNLIRWFQWIESIFLSRSPRKERTRVLLEAEKVVGGIWGCWVTLVGLLISRCRLPVVALISWRIVLLAGKCWKRKQFVLGCAEMRSCRVKIHEPGVKRFCCRYFFPFHINFLLVQNFM